MKQIELEVTARAEIGKQLAGLRQKGLIPAVVYVKGKDSLSITVDKKNFVKVISGAAKANVIFNLKLGQQSLPVITHDIQRNPLTDDILHIDFYPVSMDRAIKTRVPIELTGLPIGVKEDGGILVKRLNELEIECLPSKIPEKFVLDVSQLKIGDSLQVSDLKVPEGVELVTLSTEMVVAVTAPAKEEEVAPAEVAPEAVVPGAEAVPGAPGAPAAPGAPVAATPAPGAKGAAVAPAPKEKAPKK